MDNSLDITRIKPATGRLRLRQEIGLQILRLVDAVATRNNIPYWLDFGTLLGAIRHHGFIPWDDDIDISMPKDAFVAFLDKRHELPKSLEVTMTALPGVDMDPIIHVYEKKSLCFVDIFPYYKVNGLLSTSGKKTSWENSYNMVFSEIYSKRLKEGAIANSGDWLSEHNVGDGDIDGYAIGMEYASAEPNYRVCLDSAHLFPLRKASFEGCQLNVPAKAEECLTKLYGNYMNFPNDAGKPKHGLDSKWLSDVEMRKILNDLCQEAHIRAEGGQLR